MRFLIYVHVIAGEWGVYEDVSENSQCIWGMLRRTVHCIYNTIISIAISTVLYQLLFRVVSDLKPSFLLLSDIEGWWTERKLQLHVG